MFIRQLPKPSPGGRWQPEGLTDEGKTAETARCAAKYDGELPSSTTADAAVPLPPREGFESDKLKFAQQFGVERRGAAICSMQCVTHWLSAHADKLKFET